MANADCPKGFVPCKPNPDTQQKLFKVKAEFSPELAWSRTHQLNYAAFVSRWVRENDLLHFDRAAVASARAEALHYVDGAVEAVERVVRDSESGDILVFLPSERDIREYVKKRKISGSTRSDLGRRCRDTFTSLKKTCRKLGVSFWRYLLDRILDGQAIPPLPTLIRQRAEALSA